MKFHKLHYLSIIIMLISLLHVGQVWLLVILGRVVCPNFGHPVLTSSFTKYTFLLVKNSFTTFVSELPVMKLLQLLNGDLLFSKHAYNIY